MEIIERRGSVTVSSEDGEALRVSESNRGEPYRAGVEITIERGHDYVAGAFIEISEAAPIRDLLNRLLPPRRRVPAAEDGIVDRALDRLKLVRTPEQMALWINSFATPLCQRIIDLENPKGNMVIDPLAYTVGPERS